MKGEELSVRRRVFSAAFFLLEVSGCRWEGRGFNFRALQENGA